ncbi:MAG: mechanosensitive ion channel family protein [Jatrophihabitans sp.]
MTLHAQTVLLSASRHGVAKFLHDHGDVVIARPARILLIIIFALVLRLLAHRAINRLARATGEATVPPLLRPLKERALSAGDRFFEITPLQRERRRQRAETIGSVLKSAVSFTLFVMALLLILGELEFSLAPLIAGTSIVGVALGFGAQNIVKDFLAGIFMIMEDQYGVGDVIDVKEATGTVEAVGLRTTRLRDVHGTVWYVRNGEIIRVGNKSQGFAQVVLDVPIAPTADVDRASQIMLGVATDLAADSAWHDIFLGAPELAGIEELTQEKTVIRVTARVRPPDQWRTARELRRRIRDQIGPLASGTATIVSMHPYAGPAPGSTPPTGSAAAGTPEER